MDIESLVLFTEVMHHRSFTSVAKSRGVAPSSVSRAINTLEQVLGVRLFLRTTRNVMPTEAGLIFFNRIKTILEDLDIAREQALDITNKPQGTLRITASKVFGEMHLVPLLSRFNQRYPEISLEVLLHDRYTDLVEERIDLAIRVGSLEDSNYIVRELMPMAFKIVASPDYLKKWKHPQRPEQLIEHNCLLFPRSGYNLNWLFRKNNKIKEINIKGKHLLTQSSAIKQCTLDGMGISLLPDWLIEKEIKTEKLILLFQQYEVTATDFNSSVWMLYPSREYLPSKVKVIRDFLLEHLSNRQP